MTIAMPIRNSFWMSSVLLLYIVYYIRESEMSQKSSFFEICFFFRSISSRKKKNTNLFLQGIPQSLIRSIQLLFTLNTKTAKHYGTFRWPMLGSEDFLFSNKFEYAKMKKGHSQTSISAFIRSLCFCFYPAVNNVTIPLLFLIIVVIVILCLIDFYWEIEKKKRSLKIWI